MGLPKILAVEYDTMLLASELLLLRSGGYEVTPAVSVGHAIIFLARLDLHAIVIGHSVPRAHREELVALCRRTQPNTRILVLHSSGKEMVTPPDAAVDSREGPTIVMNALDGLLAGIIKHPAPSSVPSPQARGKSA